MKLADFDVKKSDFELSNGLRCVVLERPGMPVFARLDFKAGNRYDPPGKEGLAHFLEHMLVAGTKKFPTKSAFATYIEAFGGEFSASTSREEIFLKAAVGDPADAEVAIDVLGQMVGDSLFDDKTIEPERQSVLGELADRESNPNNLIYYVWYLHYFQKTSVGRMGTSIEGVNNTSKADLLDFLGTHLGANRGLLTISGGITASQIKALAEEHLGGLKTTDSDIKDGELAPIREEPILIIQKPDQQLRLSLGFRTCPLGHADAAALALISTIIGGGRASSLMRILRQERGLVYFVGTHSQNLTAGGFWSVECSTSKDNLQPVLDGICQELERINQGKLTMEELKFAKAKTTKSLRMHLQTSASWVNFHARHILHLGSDWSLATEFDEVEAVTMADLKRVGAKYFKPGSWYLGLVGDVKSEDLKVNY